MSPVLLVLALLGATPPTTDASLWEAAFSLSDPAQAPSAEATLSQAGPEGYAVLVKMARSGGDTLALQAATSEARCPLLPFNPHRMGTLQRQNLTPSQRAASLLGKLLYAYPVLRERALTSPQSFERQLVLIATAREPQELLNTLARLDKEEDLQVLNLALRALRCARANLGPKESDAVREAVQRANDTVEQRIQVHTPQLRCDAPGDITDELREGLASGQWKVTGWTANGEDLGVNVDTARGGSSRLGMGCAFALYDELQRRSVYVPGLVMPWSTQGFIPVKTRQEAARRTVRDLEHYPEKERNGLAVELVNAGHTVPLQVTVREETFPQETELEAAARQRQPGIASRIEKHVLCRGTSGRSGVSLLGYAPSKEAANTAWQLATRCPLAIEEGTIALLRMKDKRAVPLLEKALARNAFAQEALKRALIEHYTPAIGQQLRTLADGGSPEATKVLLRLKDEGVAVP